MFCPAKESFVTGSMITSVDPEVVSPIFTPGASSAKSLNWRPLPGMYCIFCASVNGMAMVRVDSAPSSSSSSPTLTVSWHGARATALEQGGRNGAGRSGIGFHNILNGHRISPRNSCAAAPGQLLRCPHHSCCVRVHDLSQPGLGILEMLLQ